MDKTTSFSFKKLHYIILVEQFVGLHCGVTFVTAEANLIILPTDYAIKNDIPLKTSKCAGEKWKSIGNFTPLKLHKLVCLDIFYEHSFGMPYK